MQELLDMLGMLEAGRGPAASRFSGCRVALIMSLMMRLMVLHLVNETLIEKVSL